MNFCPECRMRLVISSGSEASSKVSLKCPNCNYVLQSEEDPVVSKTIGKPLVNPVVIIGEDEAKIKMLPTMKYECERCGNTEAFWWMRQTRGGDEATTRFFRCTKCNLTWREYS